MAHSRLSWLVVAGTIAAIVVVPARAEPSAYATPPVSDAALADMRGGFELPNGMNISIGIQIDTMVNGSTVLRTLLSGTDASKVQVYTTGPSIATGADNAGKGLSVNVVSSPTLDGAAANGQALALMPNGASLVTSSGTVRLVQSNGQSTVLLDGNGLSLQHMIGALTGALVANQASNRSIDTNVTVNLSVQNSAIPTSTMLIRLDNLLSSAGVR
jgi:hypothetical protein